jgi:diguanylate cyclase (GGDEF)-like protein
VSHKIKVLIIDDDNDSCQMLAGILSEKGYTTEYSHNGKDALAKVTLNTFNIVIIDVNLPDTDGMELFKNIKLVHPEIEGIIVTGYASIESTITALRYGTINYMMKPLVVENVLTTVSDAINRQELLLGERLRLSEEIAQKEHYQALATIDGLTGLYNRRYFHEFLTREIKRADRYSHSLTMFMADIDNFKEYQDPHGHLVGDAALQYLAQIMSGAVRSEDIVARYGGEEFAVILPGVTKDTAMIIAERIRRAVEEAREPLKGKLTISIGVSAYPADAKDREQLISRADDALYSAKRSGKNATVLWSTEIDSSLKK